MYMRCVYTCTAVFIRELGFVASRVVGGSVFASAFVQQYGSTERRKTYSERGVSNAMLTNCP